MNKKSTDTVQNNTTWDSLFSEFPPLSCEQWSKNIEQDLKGASIDKLIWEPYEKIKVKPFYCLEDLGDSEGLTDAIHHSPDSESLGNTWLINQEISAQSAPDANRSALKCLESGTDSVTFITGFSAVLSNGIPIQDKGDMSSLLSNIPLEETAINFICGMAPSPVLALFTAVAAQRGADIGKLRGSLDTDPIGRMEAAGRGPNGNNTELFREVTNIIQFLDQSMPGFKAIKVDSGTYKNAGASIVQELSFSLAKGVEYISALTENDLSVGQVAKHMSFSFDIGSDYFLEIAKLRAARVLWTNIIGAFNGLNPDSVQMIIEAKTSRWNKTVYDPYVNILRSTVEAMAGSIGGCDTLTTLPFDAEYTDSSEFTDRLARNTQLIVKHESYLDKVIDPGAGSYYIETLTDLIAGASWELFLNVEKEGGLINALKSGFVQDQISETREKRERNTAKRKDVFLGVNQYPNRGETMLEKIEKSKPGPDAQLYTGDIDSIDNLISKIQDQDVKISDLLKPYSKVETIEIKPLVSYRGAQSFEELRLATELYIKETGREINVFLIPIGHLAMRNARASFAGNFFGCAGFSITENPGFETIDQAVEAVKSTNPDIAVLCSSDAEYPDYAKAVSAALSDGAEKPYLVVAGYPKDSIDELKSVGVDDFIYTGADALSILRKYQKLLAVGEAR